METLQRNPPHKQAQEKKNIYQALLFVKVPASIDRIALFIALIFMGLKKQQAVCPLGDAVRPKAKQQNSERHISEGSAGMQIE